MFGPPPRRGPPRASSRATQQKSQQLALDSFPRQETKQNRGSSLAKSCRQGDTPESLETPIPSQNKIQAKRATKVTTCSVPEVVLETHATKEQTRQEDPPSPAPSPNPSPRTAKNNDPSSVATDGSEAERGSHAQLRSSSGESEGTDTDTDGQDNQAVDATKGATCDTPNPTLRIKTVEESQAYLVQAQLIEPDDTCDTDMLASALIQISFFPGISQAMRDAVRSVALLLAQAKPDGREDVATEEIVDHVADRLTDVVKAAMQAAVAEIKLASTALMESSTKMAATATSYRDALTTKGLTTPVPSLDARVRAREGVKARQVLVDALTPSQQLHRAANNTQLVAKANEALHSTECPPSHCFVGTRRLNNGGLLLEMDSEDAASWLSSPVNKANFLGRFAPDATFKSRTYSLVVQFVPLQFRPDSEPELRDIEEANMLPKNAILWAQWIKPAYRRAPDQTCGHVLVVMTKPEDANTILTNGIILCQKRVYTKKCKKEPTRCLKCHSWGHMSYDCQQPYDVCGTCAGHHHTSVCNNHDRPHCVSCKIEGHASWYCRCPIFLSKCHEMDDRMTENQMPYYPTTDPWTHALRPPRPAPPKPMPTPKPSQLQPRSWLQTQHGATDATQATTGDQRQMYRQSTLTFPPTQAAPQRNDEPGTMPPPPSPTPCCHALPVRDTHEMPMGSRRPWDEYEAEGLSTPYPV